MLQEFLTLIKRELTDGLLDPANTIIVLGNEAFDLDSCVSTLLLALALDGGARRPLPVANCLRADLHLRPDLILILERIGIDPVADIVYLDDINDAFLKAASIALVDHNRLSHAQGHLSSRVTAVFDHHIDEGRFEAARPRIVARVASASTLVALVAPLPVDAWRNRAVAFLLLSTLLADTSNFLPALNNATDRDHLVLRRIADVVADIDRDALYDAIMAARADVSSLTTSDLLRRDLKIVSDGGVHVAFAAIPESLSSWQYRDPAWVKAAAEFASVRSCILTVITASFKDDQGRSRRQITLVESGSLTGAADHFLDKLLIHDELGLEPIPGSDNTAFEQLQLRFTRKALLPIVQQWLATLNTT